MNILSNHLKEAERREFTLSLEKIIKNVSPEKIICYGSRTTTQENWSCFRTIGQCHTYTEYDLLIITREGEKKKVHEIREAILKYNNDKLHIAAVVHSIDFVNEEIQKSSTFFISLYHKGMIVYDRSDIPLALSSQGINDIELEILEKHWNKWFGLARRALNEAIRCSDREDHEFAMCMLQQAAEYSCVAIIRTFTGYKPDTHNLSKLLDFMDNFSMDVRTIFPQNTKEEKELFNALLFAYSSIRYKEDYTVSGETVEILIDRVNGLQAIAERIYNEKVVEVRNGSDIAVPVNL